MWNQMCKIFDKIKMIFKWKSNNINSDINDKKVINKRKDHNISGNNNTQNNYHFDNGFNDNLDDLYFKKTEFEKILFNCSECLKLKRNDIDGLKKLIQKYEKEDEIEMMKVMSDPLKVTAYSNDTNILKLKQEINFIENNIKMRSCEQHKEKLIEYININQQIALLCKTK